VSNPAKQKGTSFETLVKQHLNDNGFKAAHRTVLKGGGDTGDINGVHHDDGSQVSFQCKNQRKFDLSGWLNDTVEQAKRLGNAVPALIVKRAGKGKSAVGDNYAVMRLDDLITLLQKAGYR